MPRIGFAQATVCAVACACAALPAAVAAEADDGAAFCATPPATLLEALEGTWTLRQGRGWAAAGGGAVGVTLPARPAQTMEIAALPDLGVAVMQAQGQSMILLPAGSEAVAGQVDDIVAETGIAGVESSLTGCDRRAMPSFIGTNTYQLRGDGQRAFDLQDFGVQRIDSVSIGVCADSEFQRIVEEGVIRRDLDHDGWSVPGLPWHFELETCDGAPSGSGDMDMTVYLSFDSETSAAGVLSFNGRMNGMPFAAQAPLTLWR